MRALMDLTFSRDHCDARKIDVFLPEDNPNGSCIFFVHGGGWGGGSRRAWHAVMEHFCGLGYVCTSCDYRLLPDWRFPAPVEDVRLAMAFAKDRADEYGFDPGRIAVWGSSAGAHLAALLATISADDELGVSPELTTRDTRPNAAVCLCGVMTTRRYDAHEGVPKMLDAFLGATEEEAPELVRQASPVDRVCGAEPPFLMVVGDADRTTPVALHEAMRDRLTAHGVRADLHVLPDVEHGFGYGVNTDAQKQTLEIATRFLAETVCPNAGHIQIDDRRFGCDLRLPGDGVGTDVD